MPLDSPKAKTPFWRLSLGHVLVLVTVFAIVSAVWMYRLQEAGRADVQFRAATQAGLEARERNVALLDAVREMDSETVEGLLRAGANPNYPEGEKRPLQIAIHNGDIENVRLLVAAGASVHGGAYYSWLETATHAPVDASRRLMILQELLEHDPDMRGNQLATDTGFRSKSPEIVALLRQAGAAYGPREMALSGDMDGLRRAFAADSGLLARPLTTYCMSSKSLLGIALRQGHEDLANWMLDEGAPLEVHEISDGSALHLAAVGNCAGIIQRLRQMGCDPNAGDNSGLTPLHYCISIATPATIKALIESGADVNRTITVPALSTTALHLAIRRYDSQEESNPSNAAALEIIALLREAGADVDVPDAEGQTARELARTRGLPLPETW